MKGLSFSEPMMKAWMEGNKTVTRRLIKVAGVPVTSEASAKYVKPRYRPGEIVYIKETWRLSGHFDGADCPCYRVDNMCKCGKSALLAVDGPYTKWKSPRFMPEWASRSHARIVSVRPERVQEITPEEVKKEGLIIRDFAGVGVLACLGFTPETYIESVALMEFEGLWNSLHPGSWDRNDWVWRIELEKLP